MNDTAYKRQCHQTILLGLNTHARMILSYWQYVRFTQWQINHWLIRWQKGCELPMGQFLYKCWPSCLVPYGGHDKSIIICKHTSRNCCRGLVCPITQITKFMGPTWGPPGSCQPQMGPMLVPWTLLSGHVPKDDTWSKYLFTYTTSSLILLWDIRSIQVKQNLSNHTIIFIKCRMIKYNSERILLPFCQLAT